MRDDVFLAWMAGFWEGEGSVTIARRSLEGGQSPGFGLMVHVTNVRLDPLQKLRDRWNGSVREHHPETDKHARVWRWVVCSENAARFLADIRPYLFFRHEQVETGIEFQALIRARVGHPRKRLDPAELEVRQVLYGKLHELNRNGPVRSEQMQSYVGAAA